MAMVTIISALHSTATGTLDLHVDVLPVEILLHKICYQAMLWLAMLPAAHPLQPLVHKCAKHYIKARCSPLHELAHIFDITPQEMETISVHGFLPSHQVKSVSTIHRMAEESVNHERNCCSEAKLFSDGSGMDGGAGAAAVLVVEGCDPKILKYHLGSLEDHTTFEVEAVGLSLVLHLLSGCEGNTETRPLGLKSTLRLFMS